MAVALDLRTGVDANDPRTRQLDADADLGGRNRRECQRWRHFPGMYRGGNGTCMGAGGKRWPVVYRFPLDWRARAK